jgi:hypothetical protein
LASLVSLLLFFLVGGPFGTINDVGNGAVGILSGLLAWTLRSIDTSRVATAQVVAVGVAALGAGVTVVGSVLVVSGATGFLLAGLVSSIGFALIGLWLFALNWWLRGQERWSPWLPKLGIVAGGLMAVGITTLPGILVRIDDMESAPSWVWIGFLGWIGVYVLYPVWSICFGRVLLGRSLMPDVQGTGPQ